MIIGGHGYQTDSNATKSLEAYLGTMKAEIRKAQDHDIGMDKITQVVSMPKYKSMKLYNVLHNRTVLDAYRELEMMDEDDE